MAQKSVLLIVGGGIAAYKALELVRLLVKAGIAVRPVLTRAGAEFVTPLSLAALAGEAVRQDLFSLDDEHKMGHIELSRAADLIVVAPATADLMAKVRQRPRGDLASTVLLATDKPVLMAPAMNVRMWEHPATQRNLATLKADGVQFIGPDEGAMACGEFGPGRMAEPQAIFDAILALLDRGRPEGDHRPASDRELRLWRASAPSSRRGRPSSPSTRCASSPTALPASRVTPSPKALAGLGAEVTLVSGPTALAAPPGVERVDGRDGARDARRLRSRAPGGHRRPGRRRRRLARR